MSNKKPNCVGVERVIDELFTPPGVSVVLATPKIICAIPIKDESDQIIAMAMQISLLLLYL